MSETRSQQLDIPPSIGSEVRRLRRSQNLTLEDMARRSGVSKSMLSQIERNLTNPTLATVWRLTMAFGVTLDEVFRSEGGKRTIELMPPHAIPTISSADGKCELRILGPVGLAGSMEWYELSARPGAALISEAHEPGTVEHLTVFEGRLTVKSGNHSRDVKADETVRYPADHSHEIHNPGKEPAKALLVVVNRPPKGA